MSVRSLAIRSSAVAALAAAFMAGCAATPETTVPAKQAVQPVSVSFALTANGQPARCGVPLGRLGNHKTPAVLRDARFYVQDLALTDAAGRSVPVTLDTNGWQNGPVALVDFEDGTGACVKGTTGTHTVVTGTVPAGTYTGVSFTVGVPPALNHTSTEKAAAPLDIAAMGWSWQAGRKFMKLEVDPAGGVAKPDRSTSPTWYVHLGSTGCTGNPADGESVACTRANRIPVRFEAFDTARQAVVLDLSALLQGSDLRRDRGAAVGCMSGPTDPECGPVFRHLGLSLTEGTPLVPGRSPVFSATAAKP